MRLVKTCDACPEQYNVFIGKRQVGYIRLRHGELTVSCPDAGGRVILTILVRGDGRFEDDEREYYLSLVKEAIRFSI